MPQFAVFFSDGAGFGIEVVQALDAAHAQAIARAQHPQGRLSAVPAELLDGQDRHKLLAAWLKGGGVSWATLGNPWLLSLAVTFLEALRVPNQGYDWVLACCIRDSQSTRATKLRHAPCGRIIGFS